MHYLNFNCYLNLNDLLRVGQSCKLFDLALTITTSPPPQELWGVFWGPKSHLAHPPYIPATRRCVSNSAVCRGRGYRKRNQLFIQDLDPTLRKIRILLIIFYLYRLSWHNYKENIIDYRYVAKMLVDHCFQFLISFRKCGVGGIRSSKLMWIWPNPDEQSITNFLATRGWGRGKQDGGFVYRKLYV